ncbi:hypothetical protein GCM10008931_31540 [Oceanobacillus oncorhynchi subsp. oncorhynchi]|uniref:hypothetical protein n=1 Tax=Oceanobacillus oncorhynchi TaxID=545501 RepID=UPI0031E17AD2
MSQFEENVMKLLVEIKESQENFQQETVQFNKVVSDRFNKISERFDKIESDLETIKEETNKIPDIEKTTGITYRHVSKMNEDFKTSQQKSEDVRKEQEYQMTKWLEHDRRIDKLERKLLS